MFFKRNKKKIFAVLFIMAIFTSFMAVSASAAEVDAFALAANPTESFVELLKTMFSVLGDCITSLMNAIKDGFMNLVFVDPLAETLEVSAVGIWLFVMLGLSLALSLGYYIIGILHRRG